MEKTVYLNGMVQAITNDGRIMFIKIDNYSALMPSDFEGIDMDDLLKRWSKIIRVSALPEVLAEISVENFKEIPVLLKSIVIDDKEILIKDFKKMMKGE